MPTRKALAAALLIAASSMSAHAATVTQFNFNASGGAPTTVAANLTATAITNAGLNNFSTSTNFSSPYPTNVLAAAPSSSGTGFSAASVITNPASLAATNSYFSFTVTPAPGFQMSLSSLTFDGARGGVSLPRGVAIYSVTGMGSPVFHGAVEFTTVRPTLQNYSLTLSGLANITVPVALRVYVFAPGTGNTVEMDNLTLNGTVGRVPLAEIPLPAASLAGTALLAGSLARRRR